MKRGEFICWWLPPVAWAALIMVGTSLPRVPVRMPEVSGIDKIAHLIAYGVLGLLLMRAFGRRRGLYRAMIWTLIAGGLYGAFDEWHQSWIPGRSTDLLDFAADSAGIVLAVAVTGAYHRLKPTTGTAESVDPTQTVTNEEMTTMAEALHLDEDTFESEVLNADVPALVDFWAPWCGPCQMMGPTIDKLAGDYEGEAVIAKVNVDDNPDIASKYGIRSIPALLFFSGGEVEEQLVGVQSEDALREKLDEMT